MMYAVRYYDDSRGEEPVADYIDAIADAGETARAAAFFRLVGLLEEHGAALGMPHSRLINRRERLYELRFGPHRVAYAEVNGKIVLLNAWRKRTQRLDRRAEARALGNLEDSKGRA